MTEPRRLYRDPANGKLGGVLAGMADYLVVDVTALRVVFVLITLFTMFVPGIIAYVVLLFLVPVKPTTASAPPAQTVPP